MGLYGFTYIPIVIRRVTKNTNPAKNPVIKNNAAQRIVFSSSGTPVHTAKSRIMQSAYKI